MPAAKNQIRPWSIPTACLNPYRLQKLLSVFQEIEGQEWNNETQVRFQILFIQRYRYDIFNQSFPVGVNKDDYANLFINGDHLPFREAERLFADRQYADPARRGRDCFRSLATIGLIFLEATTGRVKLSPTGRQLSDPNTDIGDFFLRLFLKWQLPNPLEKRTYPERFGYQIKPFVGTLHLIRQVNLMSKAAGIHSTGLSFDEFDAFVPTLIDYNKIHSTAQHIMRVRMTCQEMGREKRGLPLEHLEDFDTRNLRKYGEQARNSFRITRLVRLPIGEKRIDLEPNRYVEIETLLGY